VDLEEAKKAIQRLSPDGLCLGRLLDLKGVVGGVVDKVVGAFLLGFFGVSPIGSLVGAGIAELAGKLLRWLLEKGGIAKNETIECLRNIVNAAKEASQYIDDERLRGVVEEVASKWGWDVDTFRRFVKTAAGKSVTEDEVKRMIEEALKRIEEELESIKRNIEEELRKIESKTEGSKIGIGIFFLNDVENGLLYGNFIVKGGVPKIKTQLGTAKNEPEIDLVDTGKFREVAEDVLSRLTRDGRVVLTGPRGIGKSTLATYVAWSSLLGGLGKVVLDKSMDAVIRVDSLNPGDAARLNNLIEATGRRFVVIYDPSPIEAYMEPESMGETRYDVESIKKTLMMLLRMRNARVVIVLPKELHDEVLKDAALKSVLDEVRKGIINVDLRDEGFLSEIVKRYSGCGDVSEHLVERIMDFDSYTLIAKYVGVWLRENKCQVKYVDEALRESTGEPKLFFAHYIWRAILRGNEDLARRVSVPLILHAAFGPIPEGVTYITKAVNEGGVWRLIDRDSLAKSKLEDLREVDLEPIAKWLSTLHEDLIGETLEELVGLRGEEARKQYIDHGFEDFIKALNWGYEKALEEVRGLGREIELKEVGISLILILTGERLKYALKPYTNCWRRAALIIGLALAGYPLVPKLPEGVIKSLGDDLRRCDIDNYLLIGNRISPLILVLIYVHRLSITIAFIDRYEEIINEVNKVFDNARERVGIYFIESFYVLGLDSIAAMLSEVIKPSDADLALYIALFAIRNVRLVSNVEPILRTLKPLHAKAPHRYLELLAHALYIGNLDHDTVEYVFNEVNNVLGRYGDEIEKHAWSLVYAITAYASLLRTYPRYFSDSEKASIVNRVADLLNKLGSINPHLSTIAWAYVLTPALEHEEIMELMKRKLRIDAVKKAEDVLGELNSLLGRIRELLSDEEFMRYVESSFIKADEETVKVIILVAILLLKHVLAIYRFYNYELNEAVELFREAAEGYREIGDYENYLANHNWALRVETVKSSLISDELVGGFQQLYEETFREIKPTASYLSLASTALGKYLVTLALTNKTNNAKKIGELLEEHWEILNANEEVSVLTRLTLNALLSLKGELSSELKRMLIIDPKELIETFESHMYGVFLPALKVAFDAIKPENGYKECESINDLTVIACMDAVSAVMGNNDAIERLRESLIHAYHNILEGGTLDLLRELGFDVKALVDEFKKLASGLNGKSLIQLIAPDDPMAQLALMLYALINGDEKLTKAHALYGAVAFSVKPLTRLFLDVYKACEKGCDLGNEDLRQAIAKLFLYYI